MTIPTISVITPNYNHARYLTRCVDSVAQQKQPPLEHIIVDDASTDESRAVLASLQSTHPNLRVIFQDQNRGVALTVKRALEEARGDFVIGLAADDDLPPVSLAHFNSVISQNPDAALVCGEVEFQQGDKKWRRRYFNVEKPIFMSPEQLVDHQRKMLKVVSGAAIIRREMLLASAMCDPALRWLGDVVGFNVVGYRHGIWYVPEIVHHFSLNETNMSKKADIWSYGKPVLDRLFELLNSPGYSDVFKYYRRSAVLAEIPLILRYMALHPGTWRFLTSRFLANAAIFYAYRKVRQIFPQAWVDFYVNWRSQRV